MVFFCRSSFFSMRQDTPHYIETSLDHLLFSLDLFSYEANAAIQDTLDLLWPFTFLPPLDLVCDKCCKQKHTSIYLGLPPLDLFWGQCRKQDLIWCFLFSLFFFWYEATAEKQDTPAIQTWLILLNISHILLWGKCCKTRHSSYYQDLPFVYLSPSSSLTMMQLMQTRLFPSSRSALILYCSHSSSFTVRKLVLDLTRPALIVCLPPLLIPTSI